MKIASITPFLVHSGWRKNWLYVKVATDAGIAGWGEAYTQLDRDRAIAIHVEELSRYLIGRSPFHIKHFASLVQDDFGARRGSLELASAVSAIEIALWDIVGKAVGQPIHNLLGGPCRQRLRVYANGWSTGLKTPADYARAAEGVAALGFTAMKFDPFPDPWRTYIPRQHEEQAEAVVKAVRDAVGPDVDLLLEFQRRLAPAHAIRVAERVAAYRPYWIEEPCPVDNLDAIAEVRAATSVPIVTGEGIYAKAGFRTLFERRAADIVNPDVCSVGGILELKEIAAMAEPALVAVSPHNFNSTALGLAATLQASATMPNFTLTEYFVPFAALSERISPDAPRPRNGWIDLPTAPGLGLTIDEEALRAHPYRAYPPRLLRAPADE